MSTSLSVPQYFLDHLYSHAVAHRRWPSLGLRDLAARELWQMCRSDRPRAQANRHCLEHSVWFDNRCLKLLRTRPDINFVNIGGGLNTRFYRLCQNCDWPRFTWWDLELPEFYDCKKRLLPRLDHYCLQSFQAHTLAAQLSDIIARTDQPVVLLCERPAAYLTRAQWQDLGRSVSAVKSHSDVHLLFDCLGRGTAFWPRAQRLSAGYPQINFTQPQACWGEQLGAELLQGSRVRSSILWRSWHVEHWRIAPGAKNCQ